jgi:hypothetical protein
MDTDDSLNDSPSGDEIGRQLRDTSPQRSQLRPACKTLPFVEKVRDEVVLLAYHLWMEERGERSYIQQGKHAGMTGHFNTICAVC